MDGLLSFGQHLFAFSWTKINAFPPVFILSFFFQQSWPPAVWPDWATFWKFLVINFRKVAQIYSDFLCYFENIKFSEKTCFGYFLANLEEFRLLFYSNILSHWSPVVVDWDRKNLVTLKRYFVGSTQVPVWADWVIFESFCQHIFLQK